MLEEGTGSKLPRSLLLGTDMAENQKQIAQFSQKDAQVGKGTSGRPLPPSPACRQLVRGSGLSSSQGSCPGAWGLGQAAPPAPGERQPVPACDPGRWEQKGMEASGGNQGTPGPPNPCVFGGLCLLSFSGESLLRTRTAWASCHSCSPRLLVLKRTKAKKKD